MPIYEYVCDNCGKRLSFLVLKRESFSPRCNKCNSTNLRRVMSRFCAARSEESRLESFADPGKWGDIDEKNPKNMVKFMKKMGREMGDELGEDYNQMIEEAEEEAAMAGKSQNDSDDELQ